MGKLSFTSNSELVRILSKIVLFAVIFLILDFMIGMVLDFRFFHGLGKNTRINYVLKQRTDVLVIGSSRANHHYIPGILQKEIGYSVYNAGEDAKNATYELGLLDLILEQYKPKIIIYEVNSFSRNFDSSLPELYPFYLHHPKIRNILNQKDRFAPLKFSLHMYPYNQKLYRLLIDAILKSKADADGYSPLLGEIRQEEIDKSVHENSMALEPDFDQITFSNFAEIIKLCKEQDITLILVNSPLYFGESAQFISRIDSLAASNHIPFFDYYNDPRFLEKKSLFKDAGHLNNDGAILFSTLIGKKIKKYLPGTIR